jgi:N-acetylglutamate synthase
MEGERMKIRGMMPDDYSQCLAMWQATPGLRLVEADGEECIAAFLQRNPGMSFVAEVQNEVVGTVMCGQDGRRGYIYHVAVCPEYRGQHIGSTLVQSSLAALKLAGIDKCHVFVIADNELGNSFWSSSWTRRDDITLYSFDV